MVGKHENEGMNTNGALYVVGIKSYILPILLIGAILSEINITLLEGNISVKFSIGDIIIFVTVLGYVYYSWDNLKKIATRNISLIIISLIFILVSLCTSCIHNDYWLISLKFCIKICILFFLLTLIYQDSLISRGTLTALFLIMIFINVVGVLEYFYYDKMENILLLFKSKDSLATYKYSFVSSIFPSTNTFAVFNAVFIVTSLYITSHYTFLVNRYLCCLSLLLCIVGLFLSSSRNALLTLIVGVLALVVSLVKGKKNLLVAFAILLFSLVIIFSGLYIQKPLANRFADLVSIPSMMFDGNTLGIGVVLQARLDIWRRGVDLFIEKPIFGIGASQFIMRNEFDGGDTIHLHNIFAEILVNHGIVGFALFMALIGAWFKNAIRGWQVSLIITLFVSHLFDCFVFYNIIWLIFTPWIIALTTRNNAEMFIMNNFNYLK